MNKCMCPKPDYIKIPNDTPWDTTIHLFEPFLHYKKADRCCERCGRGLCGDCGVITRTYTYTPVNPKDFTDFVLVDNYICAPCNEDLR